VPQQEIKLKVMHVLRDVICHYKDQSYQPSPLITHEIFVVFLKLIETVTLQEMDDREVFKSKANIMNYLAQNQTDLCRVL